MNTYTPDGRDLRAALHPYLHDGETLLWIGCPYTTRRPRANPMTTVFLLIWCGFAVFWTVGASAAGGAFGLLGLPFVAVGIGMLYKFTFGARKKYRTATYAVTDRRAIILYTDRRGTNCVEYAFSKLSTVTMEAVQGTTGTIRFRSNLRYTDEYGYGQRRRRAVYEGDDMENTFAGIDDVQTVYRLISEQIGSAR